MWTTVFKRLEVTYVVLHFDRLILGFLGEEKNEWEGNRKLQKFTELLMWLNYYYNFQGWITEFNIQMCTFIEVEGN